MVLFLIFLVYSVFFLNQLNILIVVFGVLFFSIYFSFLVWYQKTGKEINPKNKILKQEIHNTIRVFLTYTGIIFLLFYFYERGILDFNFTLAWWVFPYCFILILYHDAFFYFGHRIMHHKYLYKYLHIDHHRSHFANYMSAYNFWVLESLVYVIAIFPIFFLELNIYALLWAVFANDFVTMLWHMWKEHASSQYQQSRFYKMLVNTTFHDVHHTHNNGNYGAYFTFWDKILWTYSKSYDEKFDQITKS